jgi:enoyl-CoA hydratase/carnithine racemase
VSAPAEPRVTIADGVATVVPAADPEALGCLAAKVERLSGADDVRVLRLRLEGEFGAPPSPRFDAEVRRRADEWFGAFERIERCRKPVLAEVPAGAGGWACELLLAVDFVLATEAAEFSLTPDLAAYFPAFGLARGPEVIGAHWTKLIAFGGRSFDAGAMWEAGLVQAVHPAAELEQAAAALAGEIAAGAPLGLEVGKSLASRRRDDGGRELAIAALVNVIEGGRR